MSKSYTTTTTQIADQRLVTAEGSLGVTGEGNSLSYSDSKHH